MECVSDPPWPLASSGVGPMGEARRPGGWGERGFPHGCLALATCLELRAAAPPAWAPTPHKHTPCPSPSETQRW